MKNIILTLISIFFLSIPSFLQNTKIEYPRFSKDSTGQVIVEMTIEQAQKLDNNSDLLKLFEKLNLQLDNYDSVCVKVINDKDIVINEQKIEIKKLKDFVDNKDQQITVLQEKIADYILKEVLYNQELSNKDKIIKEKDKQLRGVKTKTWLTGTIGGAIIVGLLTTVIYLVTK